ncbi:hypothetical protein CHS0354_015501 [Potamilus streckersoni]|uniref:COMM domain-containing protein n=1 Tax=Potamilus streckersoni TaxID=2493646 RepID=A0AAE0W4X7_9BIVA|nr:hypothetical protein CHS0354_015501 [Potamilus streckersoni]
MDFALCDNFDKHQNQTSVKMKLLCVQVVKDMLGEQIDYDKVHKITSDAKFETGDVKASIASLTFILCSAAKYNVDEESLSNELQQLGLPKEHATSLCRSYSDSLEKMQLQLRKQSLRLSQLDDVEWRIDYIISSSELKDINEPCVQLKMKINNPDLHSTKPVSFTILADKFRVLLNELKLAEQMMNNIS